MISAACSRKFATRAAGLVAVSALAIGVSACGGSSGGSSGGSATKTAAAKQSAPATTASSAAAAPASTSTSATSAAAADSGNDGPTSATASVPVYKPSTVVSKHGGSIVLTSPDSLTKIGSYYKGVLAKDGWQLRTATVTAGSASFSAHRTGEGATVSVYPSGSGSGISITTYPE